MRYKRDEHAAGASKARNDLARFLRDRGIDVPRADCPPENVDFWYAINVWAIKNGAHLPEFSQKFEAEQQMRDRLAADLRRSKGLKPESALERALREIQELADKL